MQVDITYGKDCVCKCVVLEEDYIDRDYVDGYSLFYSKAFMDYERRSKRFHFFSLDIKEDEILDSVQSIQKSLAKQKELSEAYLGYSVICPGHPATAGRTVISPPKNLNWFIYGTSSFHINLFGFSLHAQGFPFIEQDYRISACATSAIWMTASSISRNFDDLQCLSTSQITLIAGSTFLPSFGRVIPNEGLTLHQINWALKNMGFDPFVYESFFSASDARDLIYKYVESGIPVILVVRRDSGDHALVVIGHLYDSLSDLQVRYSEDHQASYYLSSDWVNGFIVHDDQHGPYREIKLEDTSTGCLISEDYSLRGGSQTKYEGFLRAVIVPFPKNIFIRAEQAEAKALSLFVWLCREAYGFVPQNFVLRTFLVSSNNFKNSLTGDSGMSNELVARYRGKPLSKHMWVTEIGALDSRAGKEPSEIKVYGEILVDSTSCHLNQDFLAIHIPFYLITMQHNRSLDHWTIVPDSEYYAL